MSRSTRAASRKALGVSKKRRLFLAEITREADILVTATGCPGLIRKKHVKEGAVVIDLGMGAGEDGKIAGDVDVEGVSKVAKKIAPSMGGVGMLTTVILVEHTIRAAKQ